MKAKLFTATNNTSCQKAIDWLDEYQIPYEEKNISRTTITVKEIQEILSLTNDGTEEIISKKAYAIKKLKVDLNALSLPQLYEVIMSNPGVLRLPIIHDGRKLQVGFNSEDIRQFLPRWLRIDQIKTLLNISQRDKPS